MITFSKIGNTLEKVWCCECIRRFDKTCIYSDCVKSRAIHEGKPLSMSPRVARLFRVFFSCEANI
jgi:hypothetical protein